jgi:hypothetical protein
MDTLIELLEIAALALVVVYLWKRVMAGAPAAAAKGGCGC